MTLKSGKNVSLKLNDSADSVRDLSAYVTSVRMSLKGRGLVDVTAMGDLGHTWAPDDLEDGTFTVDFWYEPTADTGTWSILTGLRTTTAAKAFQIGPHGNTAGYPKISGNCWLEDLPLEAAVGDMIKLSGVPFKIDAAVAIATMTAGD